mgnify:CR=1 FL=1
MSKGFTEYMPVATAIDIAEPQLSTGSLNDLLRQQLSQLMPLEESASVIEAPEPTKKITVYPILL